MQTADNGDMYDIELIEWIEELHKNKFICYRNTF